jgi:hypothetical protein
MSGLVLAADSMAQAWRGRRQFPPDVSIKMMVFSVSGECDSQSSPIFPIRNAGAICPAGSLAIGEYWPNRNEEMNLESKREMEEYKSNLWQC